MNTLLTEILLWMQNNGYRRASFDRIVGIVPSAATYDQLDLLVNENPQLFRSARMKGGLAGLALQDHVDIAEELEMRSITSVDAGVLTGMGIDMPSSPTVTPASIVTQEDIEAEIASEHYRNLGSALKQNGPATNVTLCVLILHNGFVIVGKSACVYPENFDEAIGCRLAREDAIKQLWPFLGFRMADQRTEKASQVPF